MTTPRLIPFHIDMSRIIQLLANEIYQSPYALLRENCQNAYDAILMRMYRGDEFDPRIEVSISPEAVTVTDNGIGMTREELEEHYWHAGASGKATPEARAAGVIGTFGIGGMANFGVAEHLSVTTQSVSSGRPILSHVSRAALSASDNCIQVEELEKPLDEPGTSVRADFPKDMVNVVEATAYLAECVRFLDVPVCINGTCVSQQSFGDHVDRPPGGTDVADSHAALGTHFVADVEMTVGSTGEVQVWIRHLSYNGEDLEGEVLLRQNRHQIRCLRSRFVLADAAVNSAYGLGGVADLRILQPTAGREALTTESLQILQDLVAETEHYISTKIAASPSANDNTSFMEWVSTQGRYELCGNLEVTLKPDDQTLPLATIQELAEERIISYYAGSDGALLTIHASEDTPVIVLATRQPRRKCELEYLRKHTQAQEIADAPQVGLCKPFQTWSFVESALAYRLGAILESDYFVRADIVFAPISHGLPVFVTTAGTKPQLAIDTTAPSVRTLLGVYEQDVVAFGAFVKDFARTTIFPRIVELVPSNTREGAEAFLRAISRRRDRFDIEQEDLGSFSLILQGVLDGEISMAEALRKAADTPRTNLQILEPSATRPIETALPGIVEAERALDDAQGPDSALSYSALPAIMRLETEQDYKLLTIDSEAPPLKGYRCFLALTERVREDKGEFFLQAHTTEIIWGGQKVIYVFQHHSGRFGLYYELQSPEVVSETPGGKSFPTCTIVLRNQVYIPVPEHLSGRFIPTATDKRRFYVRYDILRAGETAEEAILR